MKNRFKLAAVLPLVSILLLVSIVQVSAAGQALGMKERPPCITRAVANGAELPATTATLGQAFAARKEAAELPGAGAGLDFRRTVIFKAVLEESRSLRFRPDGTRGRRHAPTLFGSPYLSFGFKTDPPAIEPQLSAQRE